MKCKNTLLLIAFAYFITGEASADNKLLRCDNCTTSQAMSLVAGQNVNEAPFHNFYVIDFISKKLSFYRLTSIPEIGRFDVKKLSLSNSTQAAADEYFSYQDDWEEVVSDGSVITQILLQIDTGYENAVTAVTSASSTSDSKCTSAERMYSFITDSSVRTEAYQNAIIQQPIRQSINIAWNNLIDVANITVNVGGVEVDLFKIETEVFFPDGGYMRVVNRPNVPQMDVIPGSALDCKGNSIPTTRSEVPGTYYHSTLVENINFREFVKTFGVDIRVNNKTCYTGPIQTKCMPSSKDPDKLECVAVIPECFY